MSILIQFILITLNDRLEGRRKLVDKQIHCYANLLLIDNGSLLLVEYISVKNIYAASTFTVKQIFCNANLLKIGIW